MKHIHGYITLEDMTQEAIKELAKEMGQCYNCKLCKVNPYSSYCTKNADINKYSRTINKCPYFK